ncbi:MAG: competence protein ComEA [Actinomycetota bacterium]|nr:competence protein ComEA [Actinomycetota bacterium]
MSDIIIASGWRERLEELQTRRGGWIVAGFVVAAVAAALLMWARGAPAQIAPPATEQSGAVQPPAGNPQVSAQVAASPSAGFLYVDVSGAVRRPGLYKLDLGSRVADAIQAAGGPATHADLDLLNLAQLLTDGVKVDVARKGEVAPAAATGTVGTSGAAPSPSVPVVDINTADEPALEQIPGVGPVTANAILAYRTRIGHFTSIEQLLDVNGIGPATVENIRPYISI